jgi:hypothetical protein
MQALSSYYGSLGGAKGVAASRNLGGVNNTETRKKSIDEAGRRQQLTGGFNVHTNE